MDVSSEVDWAELDDPVAWSINTMPEADFLAMLNEALTGPLETDATSVVSGYPCFWETQ